MIRATALARWGSSPHDAYALVLLEAVKGEEDQIIAAEARIFIDKEQEGGKMAKTRAIMEAGAEHATPTGIPVILDGLALDDIFGASGEGRIVWSIVGINAVY